MAICYQTPGTCQNAIVCLLSNSIVRMRPVGPVVPVRPRGQLPLSEFKQGKGQRILADTLSWRQAHRLMKPFHPVGAASFLRMPLPFPRYPEPSAVYKTVYQGVKP